ncbi:MAG TPA: hypothetical protein VH475_21170 [Tepidisphaeraceae bacterium]|jgi:hypothetical protein
MPHLTDILQILGILLAVIVMIVVVRARHRGKRSHDVEYAQANVCEHLRPALDLLMSRGYSIALVGQYTADMPLEIHLQPAFDPRALYDLLKLEPPVFVSERNVLYCKEDWCELHPMK